MTSDLKITTSDEPTMRTVLTATPTEQSFGQAAIDQELASLEEKKTWKIDEAPGLQPLPTHAILKMKWNADGSVDRLKARVVAAGNHQVYGRDYMETYAQVVASSLVRMFLHIGLCPQMFVAQVDVKSAFLNGYLGEMSGLYHLPAYKLNTKMLQVAQGNVWFEAGSLCSAYETNK